KLPPAEEKRPPILVAMELLLHNKSEEALACLREYPECNQDVFLRLLPVLATMTQKKLTDLSAEEQKVLYQELDGLMGFMRARTQLLIEQMYFFEEDGDTGEYRALPEGHAFRGASNSDWGEPVQFFVHLRNLCCEKRNGYYETKLSSTVKIVDAKGTVCWW